MYRFDRLIGVGTYFILVIFFYEAIIRVKGFKIHLNLYCLALAMMGFFYVPLSGSDLGRIISAMHAYTKMSWNEIFNSMLTSSSPVGIVYYKLVGSLGDDRLLPFFSAIITYSLCFGILKVFYKKHDTYKSYIALSMLAFMSRGLLMMTIANIRSMLSLALIGYCIYMIMIENKSFVKYMILIVVGALIHNIGMLAMLLFFAYVLIRGTSERNKLLTLVEGIGFIGILFVYGRSYLLSAAEKGIDYLSYSRSSTGYFYLWEMLLSILSIVLVLIVIRMFIRKKNTIADAVERTRYLKFVYFVACLAIVSFVLLFIEFNAGLRLSWLVSILEMPTIMLTFSKVDISGREYGNLYRVILLLSLVMLFIACARGDLCSLKFR